MLSEKVCKHGKVNLIRPFSPEWLHLAYDTHKWHVVLTEKQAEQAKALELPESLSARHQ